MRTLLAAPVLLAFAACAACSSSSSGTPANGDDGGGPDATTPGADGGSQDAGAGDTGASDAVAAGDGAIGGSRPVTVHVPPGYVAGTPMPLVILLHGYSVTGAVEDIYLNITPLSDAKGFLYAHPDGLVDSQGNPYWNASDACCDLDHTGVDDSTYLSTLVTQIQAHYTVDPKRIFFMGHSNGGFMSYRMACDHADQIAAIVSLAGAMPSDVSKCKPSAPVSILEIHGTADDTIVYSGGTIGVNAYPSAATTVQDWVTLDGCAVTPDTSAPPLDLDRGLAGAETTVTTYASGCKPGGHAELWSIQGGAHIPQLSATFTSGAIDFLFAHPKP